MGKKVIPTQEDHQNINDDQNHHSSSADNSLRFSVDSLLRDNGFIIWKRIKGKEPIWKKQHKELPQRIALRTIDIEKVEDAMYLDELYYDGLVYQWYVSEKELEIND